MYKSVKKTILNQDGLEEQTSVKDLTKPIIIGIFPDLKYAGYLRIKGYLNCIKENLKMYTNENSNFGYFIEDVPFSLTYLKGYNSDQEIDEFLELIPENDVETTKKMFRNINIYCYCNGNNEAFLLMKKFHDKLISLNYQEEEIKIILEEVGILQFVDNLDSTLQSEGVFTYGTCFSITDFDDIFERSYERDLTSEISNYDLILNYKTDKNPNYNGLMIKTFGENSLGNEYKNGGREHIFKEDYVKQPIMNILASIVITTFTYSSVNDILKSKSIPLIKKLITEMNKYLEEYISKNKKEFSSYTKEDLNNLYLYLQEKVLALLNISYNLKPNDQTKIDNRVKEINQNKNYLNEVGHIYTVIDSVLEQLDKIKNYANGNLNETIEVFINNNITKIKRGDYLTILKNELNPKLDELKSFVLKTDSMEISLESKEMLKSDILKKINFIENLLNQDFVFQDSKHL